MDKIPVRKLKETFIEERFSIRTIETLTAKNDLLHELHRHDFYFVLFIKKGSCEHEIDFINYDAGDYAVFFVRPGQVHQLRMKQGTSGFMLQFTSDFYAPREDPAIQVLRKVSSKNYCKLSPARFKYIFTLLQLILQEFTQKQDRYKSAIATYLDILFIALSRQSTAPDKIDNAPRYYAQERLEEFQELLEKNIRIKKQVSDYAEMMRMTPYQLNAITKSLLKKTSSELINAHIILEAKRLLIATSGKVSQVADALGYEDSSYFIRFFKKQTGITPEAFRRNFK